MQDIKQQARKIWEQELGEKPDIDECIVIHRILSLAVEQEKERVLAMVLKEIEDGKNFDIENTDYDCGGHSYNETYNEGYHKALDTLKNKLLAK